MGRGTPGAPRPGPRWLGQNWAGAAAACAGALVVGLQAQPAGARRWLKGACAGEAGAAGGQGLGAGCRREAAMGRRGAER